MNMSRIFIERPIMTALVMAAFLRLFLWPGWESFRRSLVPVTVEESGGFDGK